VRIIKTSRDLSTILPVSGVRINASVPARQDRATPFACSIPSTRASRRRQHR